MGKLKDYLHRWSLCYQEYGLWYTIEKTFRRIIEKLRTVRQQYNENRENHENIEPQNGVQSSKKVRLDGAALNIGFELNGGIGDYLIAANYIYHFKLKYGVPAMNIDLFYNRNPEAIKSIFGDNLVDHQYHMPEGPYKHEIHRQYDLFVALSRYPNFRNRNPKKMMIYQPALLDYTQALEKFKWNNSRLFESMPTFDGQSAMMSNIYGVKRIQQADIDGTLGITEEFSFRPDVSPSAEGYLSALGLKPDQYIAIVSGADARSGGENSNKIWPTVYWNMLLEHIKKNYPEKKIVLLGDNGSVSNISSVDLDLRGKTGMEDVKILLKCAELLISNEGGMVHLRHALTDKKSIVIFGPTDMEFFGYTKNINIRGDGCKCACEWFNKSWTKDCSNERRFACMWSVSPRLVAQTVDRLYGEVR